MLLDGHSRSLLGIAARQGIAMSVFAHATAFATLRGLTMLYDPQRLRRFWLTELGHVAERTMRSHVFLASMRRHLTATNHAMRWAFPIIHE